MKEKFDIIIEKGKSQKNYWVDLWKYRELFYVLSIRDLKVRYKQTIIGVLWALIRPLITMLIFTFVFEYIAKLPSESKVPYPLLIFSGLLPWTFFSNALLESSNSLISNTNLISKVYFPRLIIPASSIITSFIDFLISFLIFVVLMIYYKYTLNWHIIFLPIYILFIFFFILGLGIFLSAINVKYRDFRYIVPFIIQLGLYISPIGYSSKIIPEKWLWLYSLNPMVFIIDGFRWCFFGIESNLNLYQILFSLLFILIMLWIGLYEFRKMEKKFADFI